MPLTIMPLAIKAAYTAGGMAHLMGDAERECPHDARRAAPLHAAWRMGWSAAERYQAQARAEAHARAEQAARERHTEAAA